MADNPLIEIIPEEAAKELVRETAKLTREMGGFLSKVFGTLPQDTVGVLGGDWLHHVRIRNAHRLQQRTEQILKDRQSGSKTDPLSPSEAIPLLNAAQDESRPELQELWCRLLANAMDLAYPPINRIFVNLLREFDILDAQIVQRLSDKGAIVDDVVFLDHHSDVDWRREFGVTTDQFIIALHNIERRGLGKSYLNVAVVSLETDEDNFL